MIEYLVCLRRGEALVLDETLERLSSEPDRAGFRVIALAEAYLLAREQRVDLGLRHTLDRAATEAERSAIHRYVEDSKSAGRTLPTTLVPGALFASRYRIERELGRGGQAVVYAAVDEELERPVAIKVMNPHETRATTVGAWEVIVHSEARLLANLKSRNIVPVYDVRADEQYSYIAMGRVAGVDVMRAVEHLRAHPDESPAVALADIVGAEAISEHETILDPRRWDHTIARIGSRAACALEAAHGEGILHRDLKPQNVMLVAGGEPVLLDFGLAARSDGKELAAGVELHGTIPYLAPEQARFYATGTDPRTDLYQLGLVLYELLTLEPAFTRGDNEALNSVIERKKLGAFQAPRDLRPTTHPALDAILRKTLAPEPDERYATAGELREDLERFDRNLPPRVAKLDHLAAVRMRFASVVRSPITVVALLALVLLGAIFILRTPAWVPPELQPILMSDEGVRLLTPGEAISLAGDANLGLKVHTSDRAVLYAFAFSGGEVGAARFLRPILPEIQGKPVNDPADYGRLDLEPGESTITCSWFDAETERHASEGLLIYVCPKQNPTLEAWQARLDASAESGLFEVSYGEAIALGEQLFESGSRGETGASVDPGLRARFLGQAAEPLDDTWQDDGFRRSEYLFPVQQSPQENP
ncbi:MAG: serine/threonine protein kinase [Planctomycetota bacterium]|jgi:serine/threonine protein kinase